MAFWRLLVRDVYRLHGGTDTHYGSQCLGDDGDRSKIRSDLGFDLPFRAKRVRKTKDKASQDIPQINAAPMKGNS